MVRTRMQNIARGARTVTSTVAALNSLQKAGKISMSYLRKALGYSPKAQRAIVSRYNRGGKSDGEIKILRKKVQEISKALAHDISVRTYRTRNTGVSGAAVNVTDLEYIDGLNPTIIEAALTNLRYWSEAAGAYVDASPTTSASNDLTIAMAHSKLLVRNNYQVPCKMAVYLCIPKEDTSIDPISAFTNGITDQDNPSSTSPLVYLTDSDQFSRLWRIEKSYKMTLQAGQEVEYSHSVKRFQYDPSYVDSHPITYQKGLGAHVWVLRISGVLGHDSAAQERGFLTSALDYSLERTVKVEYDCGGPSLNDIAISDSAQTFTNGGLVSSKPVADNIPYSAT